MNKNSFKYFKTHSKLVNPYYLELFVNRTKLGTTIIETVLSGESLYVCPQFSFARSMDRYLKKISREKIRRENKAKLF
jgi:hypothetical protein